MSDCSDNESLEPFTLEAMGLATNQALTKMSSLAEENVKPCCDHATFQKLASFNHRFQENGQQTLADMAEILEALNRLGMDTRLNDRTDNLNLGQTLELPTPSKGQDSATILEEIDQELAELDSLVESEMRKGR